MESSLMFLKDLALLLLFANIGGYISGKLNQPEVLGQIVFGLILGPSVFNFIHGTEFISHIAEMGVILLMFIAGLETDLEDLKSSSKSSTSIAIGGVIGPLVLGIGAVLLMKGQASLNEAIFVGVILTATSVSITVESLRELGKLRTRQGIGVLGAAIIDDVVGIILLTVVIGMVDPTQSSNLAIVLGKIATFFIISLIIGILFSKTLTKFSDKISRDNKLLTLALIFCFALAFIAEELGVAAIIGAYFTGVIFSSTPHRNRVSHETQRVAYALFTPIFFMNIGLSVNIENIGGSILLSVVIITAAVLGKLIGCFLGAKGSKFNNLESLQISIGMIPRAEVALIVTNLGLNIGVIGQDIFTSIILLVLVSTILTPILLKKSYSYSSNQILES
ncbi:cation:proton antiporter [Clostridium sp. D2Q-11]|uniref:Cation:proton antiporter n=1 Tax=Anaeromonas frigoriresistens TaxID=2683708 RepID=A0A942Z8Y6_9FIRM|nr:cation:proton antiporter [Anaeromonas frigoriresistens]MBS4538340.1 cation:proton antiporter [Anaeromonas frigoriresistens]